MFSVQRKKEALGRGTIKLLPRNLLNSICEHVCSLSCLDLLQIVNMDRIGEMAMVRSSIKVKDRAHILTKSNSLQLEY